ncbi:C40 family peptidase [Kitasatospora sp. NPDC056651]|uniref:C40 family peptidase n=1 Tax=Kitasatospora sp. NPDC056651 TaxID=3345892 RepID=UPI0036978F60
MKKTVGALVGVVACGPLMLALPVAIVGAGSASASTSSSCPPGGSTQGVDSSAVAAQVEAILKGSSPLSAPAVAGLSKPSEQIPNARTIQATGVAMRIPVRGQVVALATALQESELRNVNGGDRDSLGLFQQRPSQGWGTPEQIMQPVYASTKFYEALQKVSGWESMTVTQAAQAVQRSGFPDAYAKWQPLAEALQKALALLLTPTSGASPTVNLTPTAGASASPTAGGGCGTPTAGGDGSDFGTIPAGSLPNGYTIPADAPQPVQTAIRWALGQLGTAYQWGGTCANSHGADPMGRCDCSSLMQMAYRSAGVSLERTTYDQVKQGTAVSADALKPGDLLFTRGSAAVPEHVGMFIGSGLIVHAPKTGDVVKISTLASWRPEILAARRVA